MTVCDDGTQVGLFQFCFRSRDLFSGAGFPQLISMPSPVSVISQASVERPSCVFVRSQGPPSSNPAPVFRPPTPFTTCTEECCPCCGEGPTCPCQGAVKLCHPRFSLIDISRHNLTSAVSQIDQCWWVYGMKNLGHDDAPCM
jgi:hypothetical protein